MLLRWVRRLQAHHEEATQIAGEQAYMVWRLYMSTCARAFAIGRIGIIQVLFSKTGEDGLRNLPLTRKDLYPQGRGSERCPSSPAPASTGRY